jgi:hypothetical protein
VEAVVGVGGRLWPYDRVRPGGIGSGMCARLYANMTIACMLLL